MLGGADRGREPPNSRTAMLLARDGRQLSRRGNEQALVTGLHEHVWRHAIGWLAATLLASGAVAAPGSEDVPSDARDSDRASAEPPVADLFQLRNDIQAFLLSIGEIDTSPGHTGRGKRIDDFPQRLENLQALANAGQLQTIDFNDLIDAQTRIRAELRSLEAVSARLSERARLRDAQLDELDSKSLDLAHAVDVARQREAPAAVFTVAAETQAQLDETRARLVADRNAALEHLAAIAEHHESAIRLDAQLRQRREELESVSQTAADRPLWSAEAWTTRLRMAETVDAARRYATLIALHVRDNAVAVLGLFIALWAGAHWLLKATGKRVQDGLQKDATSLRGAAVFDRPSSAALLTALIGVAWLGPPAPTAFTSLLMAIIPFPAAALAVTVFARPIRLSIYTIAVMLSILSLEPLIEPLPLLGRFVLIGQALVTMGAIWTDYRHGRFAQAVPVARPAVISGVVRATLALLALTIVLEIVGFVGLADLNRSLVLGGLGLGMIFAAIAYVLIALALALLHLRPIASLPVVRNQRWTIVQTTRRWIRYLVVVLWALSTLNFAGLLTAVSERLGSVLGAEIKIGEITVDVSSLVTGAGILFATWILNKVVRFVLAGKSLSGVNVAADLTFAVSKLLRYAIACAGLLFALAAMGFDLTKVTVLAGALGVGIGFGLQNIVQNFISGLILLFERPIKINDIAKVDDLMGTVKELNIRSTVIETFDGAEVIVPNADLITKTVTNWTKSNRRRRAEIDVGVAYGTDAQQVLDILERVARQHDEVMNDPEPFAVFVGFGDSSLNFRLYIWLTDLSEVIRTPSRIRQEVLAELNQAGIEIPFPQRDVRVTMSPQAPGPAPTSASVPLPNAPGQGAAKD